MSPLGHAEARSTPSFPRVSGDEPRARWPRGSSHVFSPRERG